MDCFFEDVLLSTHLVASARDSGGGQQSEYDFIF